MSREAADLLLFALYVLTTVLLVVWTRRSVAEARRSADAAERSGSAAEKSARAAESSADSAGESLRLARDDKRQQWIETVAALLREERALNPGNLEYNYASRAAPILDQLPDWLRPDFKAIVEAAFRRVHGTGGSFETMWNQVQANRRSPENR